MRNKLIIIFCLLVAACADSGGGVRFTPNGTGDWVLFGSCMRMQSNCPGAAKVPPGAYKVVGHTVLWGEPVEGELYAYENKTLATGRLYKTKGGFGIQFEGEWVDNCVAEGRTGNQSAIFRVTRVDCVLDKHK